MTQTSLSAATLVELEALSLQSGRPLIAVDVDEVLVHFVPHLSRYIGGLGYRMQLDSYQLEGSIFEIGSEDPVPFAGCIELINQFFEHETEAQTPVQGGIEALERLARDAQIVILTNVPRHATQARRRNLDALGIAFPMVVNSGGKGRAMAWLAEQAAAPVAMVDDSVTQIESIARRAPDAFRVHFAEATFIQRLFPTCEAASIQVRDWAGAEAALTDWLDRTTP